MNQPLITFGMNVLNGVPFIRYNLRSLYPFAHQIIIVEGACLAAAEVATCNGHSTDSTLMDIREFINKEDPEKKVLLVTAESEGHSDGFWPGEKHQQSQAFAKRATGNWLWELGVDEFYKDDDIKYVINLLKSNSDITAISFPQITFWGGLKYSCDSWFLQRGIGIECPRLFAWGEGYKYVTHRPPTVTNAEGEDLQRIKRIGGKWFKKKGIYFYHYSLLFPDQVRMKGEYYKKAPHAKRKGWKSWMEKSFFSLKKPYHVHNLYEYPSWLKYYNGTHPAQVMQMMADIKSGLISIELRKTDDIDALLNNWWYPIGRSIIILMNYPAQIIGKLWRRLFKIIKHYLF